MAESLVALRDRRDHVITRLSECFATDLFEVEELERRLDLAHNARTVAELDALVADLGDAPSTALVPVVSVAIEDPHRVPRKKLRVIMGHVERRGRWSVPTTLDASVLWGNAELDFRDASLGPGVTTVRVSVTMGNIEVILPPDLAVEVDVSSFMGSVEERHRVPPHADSSRPFLRIVGAVRLGNLAIETRLPGESSRDAHRREKRERKRLREPKALPPPCK